MKKRTSIHDIARHLGVSAATVSLVLNGKAEESRIRPEVAEGIRAYVKEVGYRPNLVAKSLRTGKSRIIGMLVESISNPFFSSIARILEAEAYSLGYKLFYSSTENNTEKAKALITAFRERQVDGYIIAPSPGLESEICALIEDNYPVVLFDRTLEGLSVPTVTVNNNKGARDAISHLVGNGYRSIGLVTLDNGQQQMQERERGYLEAIAKAGLEPIELNLPYSASHLANTEQIQHFIQRHAEMDALFFATNYLALAGVHALKNLKLRIPKDIALVAFDDNSQFELFSPSVSAVAQPIEAISHAIIGQLTARLQGEPAGSPEAIILDTKLVVRESSKAVRTPA